MVQLIPQRFGRKVLLVGALVCFLGISSPVHAAIAVEDSEANLLQKIVNAFENMSMDTVKEWLSNIGSAIKAVNTLLDNQLNQTKDKITEMSQAVVASRQIEFQGRRKMTQAEIDSDTQNKKDLYVMKEAAKVTTPPTSILCRTIRTHQLTTNLPDFEASVSRLAASAIEGMYRSTTDDGRGPMYAADEKTLRYALKLGSALNGDPADSISKETVGPNKRSFQNADLSAHTLDGGVTLELPKMSVEMIKSAESGENMPVDRMTLENNEQKMWVAGLYYCIQLAGPRPSPSGDDGPNDMVTRAMYNNCFARQTAFIKKCTDLLAYYTRPNSQDKELIEDQNKKCTDAKKAIDITEFDNCQKGLSPYQAELVSNIMCKSDDYIIGLAAARTPDKDKMDANLMCASNWFAWLTKVQKKKNELIEAVRGIQELKSCWANVKSASSSTPSSSSK